MTKVRPTKVKLTKVRVTKARVTKARVTKVRLTKVRVTKARVTETDLENDPSPVTDPKLNATAVDGRVTCLETVMPQRRQTVRHLPTPVRPVQF